MILLYIVCLFDLSWDASGPWYVVKVLQDFTLLDPNPDFCCPYLHDLIDRG